MAQTSGASAAPETESVICSPSIHAIPPMNYKSVSVEVKLHAIDAVKAGKSAPSVAKELGVGKQTVYDWLRNEEKLRRFVDTVDHKCGLQRKRVRTADEDEVDKATFLWVTQQRSQGVPLTGPIIQAKAQEFARKIKGNDSFVASAGWYWRFRKRHGIGQLAARAEHKSADDQASRTFPGELRTLMFRGGYVDEQVYNADETALFWKLLPSRSKEYDRRSREHVTLLFAVNKTGSHKLNVLCVGKSLNPRCLDRVNRGNLPVIYRSSTNAWMTQGLFKEWFFDHFVPSVRSHLRSQSLEEKALLLLDCCPVHPSGSELVSPDGKIKVHFLPKNAKKFQPMDQGVVTAFKSNYRRELLLRLLRDVDVGPTEAVARYTIKDMMYVAGEAWAKVSPVAIETAWLRGLTLAFKNPDAGVDYQIPDEILTALKDIMELSRRIDKEANVDEWLAADEDAPVCDVPIKVEAEEEVSNTLDACRRDECDALPSAEEAVKHAEGLLRFFETVHDPAVDSSTLMQLNGFVSLTRSLSQERKRQKRVKIECSGSD